MIVTTGDLKEDYEIIGPVYSWTTNATILLYSPLRRLARQYQKEIAEMKERGQVGIPHIDWGFLYGEISVGEGEFHTAFYVAVRELKKRAEILGADAIISMRQDINLGWGSDTSSFYLHMYGTAVKLK